MEPYTTFDNNSFMAVSKLLILRSRAERFRLEKGGLSLNLTIPNRALVTLIFNAICLTLGIRYVYRISRPSESYE